jgi:energy-coupling factor transporter transmembrane protein EcfT
VQQGDPIVNHTVHVATWVIIVASALAALVVAVMGPIVGLILAGIEALIIFLVTKIAGDQAGKLLNSSIPATVSANVNWTYLQDFTIQQALMPTPLQLGGTIPALQSPH